MNTEERSVWHLLITKRPLEVGNVVVLNAIRRHGAREKYCRILEDINEIKQYNII